jgi:signal transduction histidine kinase
MVRINNWSIRTRLFLAFGGILIPFVAFTGIVMVASRTVRQDLLTIQEEVLDIEGTTKLWLSWNQLVLAMKDFMVNRGPGERVRFERQAAHFEAAFKSLAATPSQVEEERQLFEILRGLVSDIEARSHKALAAPKAPTRRAASATMDALIRQGDYVEPILKRLQEIHLSEIEVRVRRASIRIRRNETVTFASVLLGAAGAAALSVLFSGWLSRPVLAIMRGSRRMAEGDLSQRVDAEAGGELGEAAQAFNAMAQRLEQSAVDNVRLYEAARRRTEQIAAVNRLTKIVSASFDIGAVYETFAGELKQLLPYNRMGMVVPEESGKRLRIVQFASDQPDTAGVGRVWSHGKGTGIEWVMTHRRPHIEQDLAEAQVFVEDGALLKKGIRSTVRLPLIMKGQAIGALFLDDVVPGRYTERDLELLVPLGEQLAIAIENARLHSEMERRVEERTLALKQAQAQLIQSGKLAAVGTLAAGMAHELNQPLMVIRGYAQELLGDRPIGDEEIRDGLRRIEAQTGRMTAIINHLRDFSRESKGKRQIADLNHVVTDALTFLEQQLRTRNIAVTRELHPALPPAWADPVQIEQVFLNLVTNARDAMEAAGSGIITIRTDLAAGGRVELSVTDTGPGIPEEIRTMIFDPFFTTKEVGKGTGLGLSICHGIMEEHGGELAMESPVADGRGARFTIVLPCFRWNDRAGERA